MRARHSAECGAEAKATRETEMGHCWSMNRGREPCTLDPLRAVCVARCIRESIADAMRIVSTASGLAAI